MLKVNLDFPTSVNLNKNTNAENIAIIGVNRVGLTLLKKSANILSSSQKILGMIKEYKSDVEREVSDDSVILGELDDLDDVVEKYGISSCILAILPSDFQCLHRAVQACESLGLKYYLVSNFYDLEFGQTTKYIVNRFVEPPDISLRYVIDFVIALFSFIILFPAILSISLVLKLFSRGEIFCSQERVGVNEKIIRLFQFQIYIKNYRSVAESLPALEENPKISKIGKFLKKTSLIDLPMLINILAGDLSLIGPRSERPYYHQKYKRIIPFYENRLLAKPGIFSLAEVETWNDKMIENVREKVKFDLYFADHQKSFWLNLKILIKSNLLLFNSKSE